MPWFAPGPYFRTRRVHPSEKTSLRLVFGFSTPGDPLCAWPPWRGRAPHARSDGIGLAGACPIWPPGVRLPPMIMLCLGMSKALPCGRGDRAPPRKSPSASAPGFPREAIPAWIAPAEGRAPHAPEASEVSSPSPRSSQTRSSNEMPLTFKAVSVLLPVESSGSPRIVRN